MFLLYILLLRLPFDLLQLVIWARNFGKGFYHQPDYLLPCIPFSFHFLDVLGLLPTLFQVKRWHFFFLAFEKWLYFCAAWICILMSWRFAFIVDELTIVLLIWLVLRKSFIAEFNPFLNKKL
jgi:hypothetical protein